MKIDFSYSAKEIIENLFDFLVVFGRKGEIIYANRSLLEFFGYSLKELTGEPITKLAPREEKKRFQGVIKRIILGRKIKDFSSVIITKEKKEIPVDFSGFPLRDKKGTVRGGFGLIIDVRQIKGLLDNLGRAKSEMEEKVKERTRELNEKVEELEKFQKLAVGRELKMIELKEEINKLKKS